LGAEDTNHLELVEKFKGGSVKANQKPIIVIVGLLLIGLLTPSFTTAAKTLDEQIITDAYVYLLGRALVIRQEQMDIQEPGIDYNVIKYNPLGSADFVNPNLDVAYLEAWIAVDDNTPVLLEIPPIKGRYYTAQICDEWGEVITNINQRNYPLHPYGKFAFVAPGSRSEVPNDSVRIELHSYKAKMLARVELQTDKSGAVELQRQFKLTTISKANIEPAVELPSFNNKDLIGVEVFDRADVILKSAMDVSPIAAQMQAKVRAVAGMAADPKQRGKLDDLLREKVIPGFLKYAVTQAGKYQNNWLGTVVIGNYGDDYRIRSAANLVGIWANASSEVIYFVATRDSDGQPLSGANRYRLHFPSDGLPEAVVDAYWSVILVDIPDYRVVPNRMDRFNFNSYSKLKPNADGSLTILISAQPYGSVPESNWLPAPEDKPFSLTFRTYVPKDVVKTGQWFPPAVTRAQ